MPALPTTFGCFDPPCAKLIILRKSNIYRANLPYPIVGFKGFLPQEQRPHSWHPQIRSGLVTFGASKMVHIWIHGEGEHAHIATHQGWDGVRACPFIKGSKVGAHQLKPTKVGHSMGHIVNPPKCPRKAKCPSQPHNWGPQIPKAILGGMFFINGPDQVLH